MIAAATMGLAQSGESSLGVEGEDFPSHRASGIHHIADRRYNNQAGPLHEKGRDLMVAPFLRLMPVDLLRLFGCRCLGGFDCGGGFCYGLFGSGFFDGRFL